MWDDFGEAPAGCSVPTAESAPNTRDRASMISTGGIPRTQPSRSSAMDLAHAEGRVSGSSPGQGELSFHLHGFRQKKKGDFGRFSRGLRGMRGGMRTRRRGLARPRSAEPRAARQDETATGVTHGWLLPTDKQRSEAVGDRGSGRHPQLPPSRGSPALSRLQLFSPGSTPRFSAGNTRGGTRRQQRQRAAPGMGFAQVPVAGTVGGPGYQGRYF